MLSKAEQDCQRVDANRNRKSNAWPRVEKAFRDAADRLTEAQDPLAGRAWLGVAHATRYQRGHRDVALDAYVQALYLDRERAETWCKLVDCASAAPHGPTFIRLLARCPIACREPLLRCLVDMSRHEDRLARMTTGAGKRLRAAMLDLVTAEVDQPSITLLNSFPL